MDGQGDIVVVAPQGYRLVMQCFFFDSPDEGLKVNNVMNLEEALSPHTYVF
jgi:hypothetical protein